MDITFPDLKSFVNSGSGEVTSAVVLDARLCRKVLNGAYST